MSCALVMVTNKAQPSTVRPSATALHPLPPPARRLRRGERRRLAGASRAMALPQMGNWRRGIRRGIRIQGSCNGHAWPQSPLL